MIFIVQRNNKLSIDYGLMTASTLHARMITWNRGTWRTSFL